MSHHQVTLVGRATADTKLIQPEGKREFASFSVAVNNYLGKDKPEDTTFYECLVFGKKQVQAAGEKVRKGDMVMVTGRPSISAYLTKKQEPKSSVKVMVTNWQSLAPTVASKDLASN